MRFYVANSLALVLSACNTVAYNSRVHVYFDALKLSFRMMLCVLCCLILFSFVCCLSVGCMALSCYDLLVNVCFLL